MDYADFLHTHRVMLAPMAGVSDPAFRQICIESGASLAFTEMVSAKGLSYANERTAHLLDLFEGENLVGVQIFGHEPTTMAEQAKWLEQTLGEHLAVIDINMGCPVRKIAGKGDGAALIQSPELAHTIISCVVNAVEVPVTVKTRRGFRMGEETCVSFATMAQEAGASAVAIHGRFAEQMYAGKADWGCIARTKEALSIPVVGNGDVFEPQDALNLFTQTGCDAILVARGSQGNPWLFAHIANALAACGSGEEKGMANRSNQPPLQDTNESTGAFPSPTERIETARRHAHLLAQRHPKAVVRMRKHASWYVKGLPGATAARAAFNACLTVDDFDRVFDSLLSRMSGASKIDESCSDRVKG